MAEVEGAELLRRLANNVTTSSITERVSIFHGSVPALSNIGMDSQFVKGLDQIRPQATKQAISENVVKVVCKVLCYTPFRYRDSTSRRAVLEVVRILAKTQPEATVRCLLSLVSFPGLLTSSGSPSKSSASGAAFVLNWTCILAPAFVGQDKDLWTRLVDFQADLFSETQGSPKRSVRQAATKSLKKLWDEHPHLEEQMLETILQRDRGPSSVVMAAALARHMDPNKLQNGVVTQLAHLYVRNILQTRTKPPEYLLVHFSPLLKLLSHKEFNSLLLPALLKALLRSPELSLKAVDILFASVSLDLSQYALDISKSLRVQLLSNSSELAEGAVAALSSLARQCSNGDMLDKVVKHHFNVLTGSEEKLKMATQKINILSGLSSLSHHAVTGTASQTLQNNVINILLSYIQQEAYSATQTHAVGTLSAWCSRGPAVRPSEGLLFWASKALAPKGAGPLTQLACLQCLGLSWRDEDPAELSSFVPSLLLIVERAVAQTGQVSMVTEALPAALLLLRLAAASPEVDSNLGKLWEILFDKTKQLFTSEKFLSQASDEAICTLLQLSECLLLQHAQRLHGEKARSFHRIIVWVLISRPWPVRQKALQVIHRLIGGPKGVEAARDLISQLWEVIKFRNEDEGLNAACALWALSDIPSLKSDNDLANLVARDAILPSHQPCIESKRPGIWLEMLHRWGLNPKELVNNACQEILTDLLSPTQMEQAHLRAMVTMALVSPSHVFPSIVHVVTSILSNPDLCLVSQEDVKIMNTPNGQLWNKEVLKSSQSDSTKKPANLRRENRAYSYQDQMLELELKEELKKKKGEKEPQLTTKQKEMMQEELNKESEIRHRLLEMDKEVSKTVSILEALLADQRNGRGFRRPQYLPGLNNHLPAMLEVITPLLITELAGPRLVSTYLSIGRALIQDRGLGESVSQLTLSLLYRKGCGKGKGFQGIQDLHDLMTTLHRAIVTDNEPLSSPAFCLCFPLLEAVLRDKTASSHVSKAAVLDILAAHSQDNRVDSGADGSTELKKEDDLKLLPRQKMMDVLLWVIGTASQPLQVQATSTLSDLCSLIAKLGSEVSDEKNVCLEPGEVTILLQALEAPGHSVRHAALMGLVQLSDVLIGPDDEPCVESLTWGLWLATHDPEPENKAVALKLWQELGLLATPEMLPSLLPMVQSPTGAIRSAGAAAIAAVITKYPELVETALESLKDSYKDKLHIAPPVMDPLGRVIVESPPDQWEARCGVALAIKSLAPHLTPSLISFLVIFLLPSTQSGSRRLPGALGDRHSEVRKEMLNAALSALEQHGKECMPLVLPLLEGFLSAGGAQDPELDSSRQAAVVLTGSLARHLDSKDPRVPPIVQNLMSALSTPSQQVQEAISACLPPLTPAVKDQAPKMAQSLLATLLDSECYGERKGAAHGLAGLVKGLGILSLKQLDIMSSLTNAIQDKKSYRRREGALFAFETLCSMLGRLFEPYIVHALPHLLLCFGDGNQYVREAAEDTAKMVMKNLSTHGVKLVLPSLLAALDQDSWRTKTGSVELLGSMAYCAPKQLSACLPSIVPKLTAVLTDSHSRVQRAGTQALHLISSVIRNPEIQAITPVILEALTEPGGQVQTCLQTLLDTKFVHFVDAASLALIMPIVQRAFMDRSTDTRKMAAQIIGNMYSLTDQKDLAPYLPSIIPGLKTSLLDPVPEVRAVSARALGAMVRGMGESSFQDLLPWLMETLTSEQSSVDRSGAAQGLAEVLVSLGAQKMQTLIPDIIGSASRAELPAHVRDGYLLMFVHLPATFGEEFTPYLGQIIPAILKGLADETEFVRDTALSAGQGIVTQYAERAISLLLPELELGLFHDNWRIRFSSVQLLGDLLFHISGVTGKMTTESASDDDNFGTVHSTQVILEALGVERRNRVLAGLYLGRSDVAASVRQASLHVWKVVVSNTPRTLREILPTLFSLLVGFLASESYDKRQIAARTLGDLVRKLGEKVLPEVLPILESGLNSPDGSQRQGVCIALGETMRATSKETVLCFAENLVPPVRRALMDPLPSVRTAAAKTFEQLHVTVGYQALDDVLPALLSHLDDDSLSEFALDGLRQVMAIRSRAVLPYLIPKLTTPPVNIRVLAFLASGAGEPLTKYLDVILPALLTALSSLDPDARPEKLSQAEAVILAVEDELGSRLMTEILLEAARGRLVDRKAPATALLAAFCTHGRSSLTELAPTLLRGLIILFGDSEQEVLGYAWDALNSVVKRLEPEEQQQLVRELRPALRISSSDLQPGQLLPGLCLPKKGVACVLPVLREGLLSGSPDQKEESALALQSLVALSSAEALRPSLVHLAGPLIRVLGDRFAPSTRTALLDALALLLDKVGVGLKAFLPQLQTTFLRALQDPSRSVRLRAAAALGKLAPIHSKPDGLVNDLAQSGRNAEDIAYRETSLQALRLVLRGCASRLDPTLRRSMATTLQGMLGYNEEGCRIRAAACLGELAAFLPEEEFPSLLNQHLLAEGIVDWPVRHSRAIALSVLIQAAPGCLVAPTERFPRTLGMLTSLLNSDRDPVVMVAIRASAFLIQHLLSDNSIAPCVPLYPSLVKCLQHSSSDVRLATAQAVTWAFWQPTIGDDPPSSEIANLKPLLRALLDATKDRNSAVRVCSDAAIYSVLQMDTNQPLYKAMYELLDPNSRDLLTEVHNRHQRLKSPSISPPSAPTDETLLS
uniref:stalled ribosome sensor GCN1 isoform X2 n=1 Tax=Myxine glutinosa TaxID=7769 RepID=UPI00358E4439